MNPTSLLALVGLLATTSNVPTLPVTALHPGQKAVVRTVFAGDSIETFEAQIVGVLDGGRSEGQTILALATSPRVVQCGVAQGMSGSPVYVDGKLIGALSSGWSFSKEPIFGITPIGEMLDVLDRPETPGLEGTAGPAGLDYGASPRFREFAWSDDSTRVPAVATPERMGRSTLALPLSVGGLNPGALGMVRDMFAPQGFTVTPGGRSPAAAGDDAKGLVPGAAVAVDLMRGDLNMSAIGTVTYRDGDRVLIFGHPFFQGGEMRLPLSTAHIVTILPSLTNSFKLGVSGAVVGTATQDRRPAVAGRIGAAPRLLPMRVAVEQEGRRQEFRFELAEDRLLFSQLVAAALMNAVLEAGGGQPQQTVAWSMRAARAGRVLALGDEVSSEAPLQELVGGVTGPLRFLYGNPFERFGLDSLAIEVKVTPGRAQYTLRSASLGATVVRPGGTAHVHAEIERWRGVRSGIELDVPVPAELPDGHYSLWLGGGAEFDRFTASRLPSRYRPGSLADAWQRMALIKRTDALHSALWVRTSGVTSDGEPFPELPVSALAVLAAPQSSGDRVRREEWSVFSEQSQAIGGALRGELLLDIVVDRKAP